MDIWRGVKIFGLTAFSIIAIVIIIMVAFDVISDFNKEPCSETTIETENSFEAKVSVVEHKQNYSIRECIDYCQSLYWQDFRKNCMGQKYCFDLCRS